MTDILKNYHNKELINNATAADYIDEWGDMNKPPKERPSQAIPRKLTKLEEESQAEDVKKYSTMCCSKQLVGNNDTSNLPNYESGKSATSLGQGGALADTSKHSGTLFIISI